jgi:CHAT domain
MNAPIVTIKVAVSPDREVVRITALTTGECARFVLRPGTLQKARMTVAQTVRKFKDDVDIALTPSAGDVKRALRGLYMRASLLAGTLTPDGTAGVERISRLFVGAFPDWQHATEVPSVEVEGPAEGLPFELMPVFDLSRPGTMDDIEQFARRFLAFSTVVRRVPYISGGATKVGLGAGQRLENRPKLPITFLWYAPMSGARQEYEFFARRSAHIELNGPWPPPHLDSDTVLETLTDVLFDPARRFQPAAGGPHVQIQHFACHCDTGSDDPAEYELELAGGEGESWRITLGELNMAFLDRQRGEKATSRPLVFLNACGSAHLDPWRVYSWPEWFMQNGHRGVIGTGTLIPDRAAARFAGFLYEALLSRRPLGEALVLARRRLLHEFGNPLGLLYVLYADPDIILDKPIPKESLHG